MIDSRAESVLARLSLEILSFVRVFAGCCNELNVVVTFVNAFVRSQSHSERLKTFFKTQKLRDMMSFQVICP
jgi:hypothetical protein